MATSKLFISHSSSDAPLVVALINLIEGGIGVSPHDIFCSSIKGQGIIPGVDFKSSIRDLLDEATCVITLISQNYYGSAFCMCELGGAWIQAKKIIPMLAPPLESKDLKAILLGLQTLKMCEKSELDELRDEVVLQLKIAPLPTPRWNERRDQFLESLSDILLSIPNASKCDNSLTFIGIKKQFDDIDARYMNFFGNEKKLKRGKNLIAFSSEGLFTSLVRIGLSFDDASDVTSSAVNVLIDQKLDSDDKEWVPSTFDIRTAVMKIFSAFSSDQRHSQ